MRNNWKEVAMEKQNFQTVFTLALSMCPFCPEKRPAWLTTLDFLEEELEALRAGSIPQSMFNLPS